MLIINKCWKTGTGLEHIKCCKAGTGWCLVALQKWDRLEQPKNMKCCKTSTGWCLINTAELGKACGTKKLWSVAEPVQAINIAELGQAWGPKNYEVLKNQSRLMFHKHCRTGTGLRNKELWSVAKPVQANVHKHCRTGTGLGNKNDRCAHGRNGTTVMDKQSLQMLQRLRENFLRKTKARFEFSWVKYTQNHTSKVIPMVFLVCQIFPGFDWLFFPLCRWQ